MRIRIIAKNSKRTQIFYDKLSGENLIIAQTLLEHKGFKQKLDEARNKFGISIENNQPNSKNKINVQNILDKHKKSIKAANYLIDYFELDSSWEGIFTQLISSGEIYNPTPTIKLEDDGKKIKIVIQGYIKSKNQIRSWVEENWSEIKELIDEKFKQHLKRQPKLHKLKYYKRIIELRDNQDKGKLPFNNVADKLIEEFPELETDDAKVNEFSVKNIYHIYKKLLSLPS